MANTVIFDIKRDNELIANGTHFWCETCLVARPLSKQSPDHRYCQSCYDFLLNEVEILKESRSLAIKIRPPQWMPGEGHPPTLSPQEGQNLSTLEKEKVTVDIIGARVGKRGPKKMELPEDKIREMNEAGMGSKAIAGRLKAEYGVQVSYKTIQRLLQ